MQCNIRKQRHVSYEYKKKIETSLLGDIDVLGTLRFVRRGNLGR